MMVSMEVYLRRGQKSLQRFLLNPQVRGVGTVLAWWGSGFFLSGASLMHNPQPLAAGLICAAGGWQAVAALLGAMTGYPVFWGLSGGQGIVWSAAAGLLALMLGSRTDRRDQPLMLPALTAFMVAVTGLVFQIMWGDKTPFLVYILRTAVTFLSGALFAQAFYCRDPISDWLVCGVGVLALAQAAPVPWLGLGYVAAGLLAASGAFPAAALAGLGLDLAQVTQVPMTAVMCMAYFARMIPFDKKWQAYATPGIAYGLVMLACGLRDPLPVPGLVLGGALGALMPAQPRLSRRRGETGLAQVRLELGAEVLTSAQRLLLELEPPPIDQEALIQKVRDRACGSCSVRRQCTQKDCLGAQHLEHPMDADCRKPGRLIPELHRAREQLLYLKADRLRQREYRGALVQQYRFLGDYMRALADRLPHRGETVEVEFRIEVSARTRGKHRANGDRCLAFPGPGCRYYVLLCDGMGTGLGAAQEGHTAGDMLRRMLTSGFPAEHALRSYNSFLALRGAAGAVTMDLAEVHLDTGSVSVYKWGAAPSWVLTRRGVQKIGTATTPPGVTVGGRETVEKLSLRRGEVLILLSDGVDGEDALRLSDLTLDAPPGELAAKILKSGGGKSEDDATAAVIRLRPTGLGVS